MRAEIGTWRRGGGGGLGDAASDFAASVQQLSAVARAAYAARQANDGPAYAVAMNQYRRMIATLIPQQKVQVAAALAQEMPSKFLQDLAGWGDWFASAFKNPVVTILIVAALGAFFLRGATQGMRKSW